MLMTWPPAAETAGRESPGSPGPTLASLPRAQPVTEKACDGHLRAHTCSHFSCSEVWLSFSPHDRLCSLSELSGLVCLVQKSSLQPWEVEAALALGEQGQGGRPRETELSSPPSILRGCQQGTCQSCGLGHIKSLLWLHSSPQQMRGR